MSKNGSVHKYAMKNGVLYREFQGRNLKLGNIFQQLVVPAKLRIQVMKLAHEAILGGQQGSKKTTDKVLTNFFWPGVQADIRRYSANHVICVSAQLQKGG